MATQKPGMETQKREQKVVHPGVDPGRGNDPGGYGQHDGHQNGEGAQFQGGGEPLSDHADDPLVALERAAQIAANRIAQPFEVADVDRFVEPQFGPDLFDRLLVGAETEHDPHRVAGAHIDQRGDQNADDKEHRYQQHQPAQQILEQGEDSLSFTFCRLPAPSIRPPGRKPTDG
jgi:hypothetical protein